MTAEIIIAIHKPCAIPAELASDGAYIPLFVGAASSKPLFFKGAEVIRPEGEVPQGYSPMRRDDSGVNISEKNPGFSELTGGTVRQRLSGLFITGDISKGFQRKGWKKSFRPMMP